MTYQVHSVVAYQVHSVLGLSLVIKCTQFWATRLSTSECSHHVHSVLGLSLVGVTAAVHSLWLHSLGALPSLCAVHSRLAVHSLTLSPVCYSLTRCYTLSGYDGRALTPSWNNAPSAAWSVRAFGLCVSGCAFERAHARVRASASVNFRPWGESVIVSE